MLTFQEIRECEGYYYNVKTGDILRNVGPGDARCWREGSWDETAATAEPDVPEFELLTTDVLVPLQTVLEEAACRYGGNTPVRVLNRQTARQLEGGVVTEEAASLVSDAAAENNECCSST